MSGYSRKKQPELVRRALLDCAAKLTVEHGLSALTVQAVAKAAGVTKGGLFHHFASKQVLVASMFADLVEKFDEQLAHYMAANPVKEGKFTRAYVEASLNGPGHHGTTWAALMAEPELCALWDLWLKSRLEQHSASVRHYPFCGDTPQRPSKAVGKAPHHPSKASSPPDASACSPSSLLNRAVIPKPAGHFFHSFWLGNACAVRL